MRVDVLDGAGGVAAVPQVDRVEVGGGEEVAVDPLPADLPSFADGVERELRSRRETPVPNVDAIVPTAEKVSLQSCSFEFPSR